MNRPKKQLNWYQKVEPCCSCWTGAAYVNQSNRVPLPTAKSSQRTSPYCVIALPPSRASAPLLIAFWRQANDIVTPSWRYHDVNTLIPSTLWNFFFRFSCSCINPSIGGLLVIHFGRIGYSLLGKHHEFKIGL